MPRLRFTPVLSLDDIRVCQMLVEASSGPSSAGWVEWLGRAIQAVPAPRRLAVSASLVEPWDGELPPLARSEAWRITVLLGAPTQELPPGHLEARAARWRRHGLRIALCGFSARRDQLAAVVSQTFDEVWLAPRMTRALPLAATPARGLLAEAAGVLRRRQVALVAAGVATPQQLDGAIELGLAGALGPLLGMRRSESHVLALLGGGYHDAGAVSDR